MRTEEPEREDLPQIKPPIAVNPLPRYIVSKPLPPPKCSVLLLFKTQDPNQMQKSRHKILFSLRLEIFRTVSWRSNLDVK